jgi:hypothetical protein
MTYSVAGRKYKLWKLVDGREEFCWGWGWGGGQEVGVALAKERGGRGALIWNYLLAFPPNVHIFHLFLHRPLK